MDTTKVSVGITTVIGWLTAVAGAIPIIVKLLEEGQKGLTLAGPEKWGAIISVVALAVTQLGRYLQAIVKTLPPPPPPPAPGGSAPVPPPAVVAAPAAGGAPGGS
jgi:hypothetical protein